MKQAFTLRTFSQGDESAAADIYVDAIRNGTFPHYTAAEALAWAPDGGNPEIWAHRLSGGTTWIGETAEGPAGFITLRSDGHLDLLFVRPAARPLGMAAALYDQILEDARTMGHRGLTTHASILARRFLARRGWRIDHREMAHRNGAVLTRYHMTLGDL